MTSREMLLDGNKWTDEIARYVMPILLWCAKNGKKISYGELEHEMSLHHTITVQQVKTKYGHPAGKVGDIIFKVAEELEEDIPPINAIIVRKDTGLPSKGVDSYIRKFIKATAQKKLTQKNRDELTREVIQAVFDYPFWQKVAEHLGYARLTPVSEETNPDESESIKIPMPKPIKGGSGESEEHRSLKKKIANSSSLFKEFGKFNNGEQEFFLLSGDEVDVVFKNDEMILAVEVKAENAPVSELVRGIYQCVKYRATLRAMQLANGALPNAQSVLATAIPLSGEIKRLASRLKVHWIHIQ